MLLVLQRFDIIYVDHFTEGGKILFEGGTLYKN